MSSVEYLREFVNGRLTAAAEEIFGVFKQTIVEYEEEIDRQRRLLDIVWNPEIKLHRIELPQHHGCTEEEVLADQQLCIQERNSSLDPDDPESPQIKEEQEELCTSQEGEQLVLKQETDTFMLTPTDEENDHSKNQTLKIRISSVVSEPNNQKGGERGGSGSTRNAEPEPQKRHRKSKSYSNKVHNSTMSKVHCNTHTELPLQHVCRKREVLADQKLCIQERNSSLDQEDPEPPQIKEGQEKLCTSQEGEQLILKQETDTFMWTPTDEESDNSQPEQNDDLQLLSHNCHVAESQDEKGDSESTRDVEPKLNKRHDKSRGHSNNVYNPNFSEIDRNTLTGKKSIKCDTCGKAFKFKSGLKRHMSVHTGEKPYSCKTCGKRFCTMPELREHIRVHTGEKPYICTTCGRAFSQSGNLTDHMRRAHIGLKPYTCNTCGKKFCKTSELNSHTRIHTGEKPYTCKTCGRAFRFSGQLTIHMRRAHTGEMLYLCKTCRKKFCTEAALKRHMRIHTGEKPYTCTTCGRAFSQSGNLADHMRRAHIGLKPYTCKTCGKRFCKTSELNSHTRIHTGEKPYTCNTCGRAFRHSGYLTVHMRRAHTGEKP